MAPALVRKDSVAKRKPSASTPAQPPHQQKSIAHHFTESKTVQQKIGSPKRRKLNSPELDFDTPVPIPVNADTMYSFGSSSSSTTPIDLTDSPSASPKPRRISSASRTIQPGNPYVGARKLTVKNVRPRAASTSDHTQYLTTTLGQLDAALSSLFQSRRPDLSNEELYRGVENVCKLGKAADLAKLLFQRCREHVATDIKQPLLQTGEDKGQDVLRSVIDAWNLWLKQLVAIRSIFFYLDRSHLLQTQSPSIYDSAVSLFRSHVFGDAMLQPKIVDGACNLLRAERLGETADPELFAHAVKMFHELGVYTNTFEHRMLAFSQGYISEWSDTENEKLELADFVIAATSFIADEMVRCDRYALDATTRRELLTLLEHHLIERRQTDLTNDDAVADLLDADDNQSLGQLYSLLQRRRLGSKLKPAFEKWIDDTGTAIVFDEKGQDEMVVKLLALKQKLDQLWRTSFQTDEVLGHTLREAFEAFINKTRKTSAAWGTDNSKPGEMIAKYVDQLLRSGAKAIPVNLTASVLKKSTATVDEEENEEMEIDEDSEVNNQLDQVLDLFRFVHGKAVFEAFYKKDLARRLLMDRSASKDAEISMLERLKSECGSAFTQNLEQMFKDIELAKEEMSAYKSRLDASERRLAVDLNVNILSASAWPTYPDVQVIIPTEIRKAIDNFEQVYQMKHSGRKLQWKHALAHCQLRADFPRGRKELVVSSFQAIVLLLFNNVGKEEHLSYERIKAESDLTDVELKRTLQSLACAKLRPLTKHPRGREVDEADTFTLNLNFSHERARVKINAIQLKETKEENRETHERVAADRQFETQAAIVRIMKGAKRITHQQLIAETIAATRRRGTLQPAEIKKQIDKLIEKEYMEREDGGWYAYLA